MITNIPPTTVTSAVAETPTISHGNANRESNETEMVKGVLTQIQFPTGGTTTFTFEANTVSAFGRSVAVPVYTLQSCSSPISLDCCGTSTNGQKLITGTYRPTTEDIQSGTFVLALDKLSGNNGASPCPIYDPGTYIYVFNGSTRVAV